MIPSFSKIEILAPPFLEIDTGNQRIILIFLVVFHTVFSSSVFSIITFVNIIIIILLVNFPNLI